MHAGTVTSSARSADKAAATRACSRLTFRLASSIAHVLSADIAAAAAGMAELTCSRMSQLVGASTACQGNLHAGHCRCMSCMLSDSQQPLSQMP